VDGSLHRTLHSTFARFFHRSVDSSLHSTLATAFWTAPCTAPCTAPLPDLATTLSLPPHCEQQPHNTHSCLHRTFRSIFARPRQPAQQPAQQPVQHLCQTTKFAIEDLTFEN